MDWDAYERLLNVKGNTRQERAIFETQRSILKRSVRSPAYKTVLIDGVEQNVVITAGTELFTKKINALPNEHIYAGSVVVWNNQHWIITNADCEDDIYQRGIMFRCNICLKWQDETGAIKIRYGYSENLSQFASGTVSSRIMDSIQFNINVRMPMDQDTVKLRRDKRFLIDVISDDPNAYIVTNRNVITENYFPEEVTSDSEFTGKGKLLILTLSQTQRTDNDNVECMIADYIAPNISSPPTNPTTVEITYNGNAQIKVGGSYKTFAAKFIDATGNELNNVTPNWSLIATENFQDQFITSVTSNGKFKVKAMDNSALIGTVVRVIVDNGTATQRTYKDVEVVSIYG